VNISEAVARVYAEALLDMAKDKKELASIVDDLEAVHGLWGDTEGFRRFFCTPRLDPTNKKRILDAALEKRLGRPVLGLLHVLVDKRREPVLDNVIAQFEKYKDLREGRTHAHLTSARPLDKDQVESLRGEIERISGKQVMVHEKVDPAVLGGLRVRVGDYVLDGTLRRRLDRLRHGIVNPR
jgi:F-type H+-transporting ATPase subunit delta